MITEPSNLNSTVAEVLRNAFMATLLLRPKSKMADHLVDRLCSVTLHAEEQYMARKRGRTASATSSLRLTIGALAADLIANTDNAAAHGFCYRSVRWDPTPSLATQDTLEKVVALWERAGLLHVKQGMQIWTEFDGEPIKGKGFARRLRATPALISLSLEFGITAQTVDDHFLKDHTASFPIVLKPRKVGYGIKGRPMRFAKTSSVKRLASEVREINSFAECQDFGLNRPPQFKRQFNNGDVESFSWDQGGRLTAVGAKNFQTQTRQERSMITVNGGKVVEIDIKASHLTIFHGLAGCPLDFDEEPYTIDRIPRFVTKAMITAAFGAGQLPEKWPSTLCVEYKRERHRAIGCDHQIQMVRKAILNRHPLLASLSPTTPTWARLQFVESEVIVGTLLSLIRLHRIPALPIHDSIIVRQQDAELASDTLCKIFRSHTGIVPRLENKGHQSTMGQSC